MTMQTLRTHPETTHGGSARAVKLELCDNHQFMTFLDDCGCQRPKLNIVYTVIGTEYGKLHNTSGGWRLWNSPSGAYRAAREYRNARQ